MIDFSFLKGYELARYEDFPVVLVNHDFHKPPVGTMIFKDHSPTGIKFYSDNRSAEIQRGLVSGVYKLDPVTYKDDKGRTQVVEVSVVRKESSK